MARYPRIDWTSRDYSAARADILALLATLIPDFTQTDVSDEAMTLYELLAWAIDLLSYYQDRQANESFLITATQRDSVIRHLRMIGYRLATAAPASTTLTFTLDKAYGSPVTVQALDAVLTLDGAVSGEATALGIPAGSTTGTATWTEGETIAADLGESDGTASQRFALGQTAFLWGSESVSVDGVVWTRVDDFLDSDGAAQVYTIEVDAFDQATIVFGDGVNGRIPAASALAAASYRIGGGLIGNVEAGTLTRLAKSYTTADGTSVRLSVTNAAKATGGADRETIEHAKVYGPKSLATNHRAVTSDDYVTIAEGVTGVARALAQTIDDDPTIPENTVIVQVVPVGASAPSLDLLDAVEAAIRAVKTNTTRLWVVPALYLDVALVGTVYLRKGKQAILSSAIEADADAILRTPTTAAALAGVGATAAQVDSLTGALDLYFDAQHIDVEEGDYSIGFGARVALSDLLGTIRDSGTFRKYADLTTPAADIVVASKRFPRLRAYTKVVLTSPDRVVFTWNGLGTTLTVQEES